MLNRQVSAKQREKAVGCRRLLAEIGRGMAATGLIYDLPPIKPVKYERPRNADLVAIGGDMWRAVGTYQDGQSSQQA